MSASESSDKEATAASPTGAEERMSASESSDKEATAASPTGAEER
jgi:hypothetical protein